jgi:monoamine oxidase
VRSEFESLYAAPLDDISARHGWEDYELPGGDHVITGGLGEALVELAAGLDVRFGHRVGSLTRRGTRWRSDSGMAADAVIVTVSAAALRGGRITFDPPLPAAIVAAMAQLGAGPVCKLFVTYDEAWWPPVRAVRIAGDSPLALGVDVTALVGLPSLCWFAVGDDARRIEEMTEDAQCRLADAVAVRAGLHA